MMKTPLIPLAAAALGLVGCATYPSEPAYGPPAPPYGAGYGSAGYGVMTASKPPFGTYLVAADGRSLYILEGTRGTDGARCSGECLRVWPPLHAGGPPSAGGGVDPASLSAVMAHGAAHVTYAGWPLYYYHRDRVPGDTTGQHVVDRWGTWHLVSPSGAPVRPAGRY